MGPYRPIKHNCRAQVRSWHLSSSEAKVANNQTQPLKAEHRMGRAKSGSLSSTVTSADFREAKLDCLCAQPQRASRTKLVDRRR